MSEGDYLVTLVLHDQSNPFDDYAADYEAHLVRNGLPDIPFHMKDLLHGHEAYEGIEQSIRKKLLIHFGIFMQKAPIRYRVFAYDSYDTDLKNLSGKLKRDIVDFIFDNLEWFQSFDQVPIYYDEGQQAVTKALHEAFDYMLGKEAVEYRLIGYQDRRPAQAADYYCSIERIARRYERKEESDTYRKFFGLIGDFKRNYLKQARRKAI